MLYNDNEMCLEVPCEGQSLVGKGAARWGLTADHHDGQELGAGGFEGERKHNCGRLQTSPSGIWVRLTRLRKLQIRPKPKGAKYGKEEASLCLCSVLDWNRRHLLRFRTSLETLSSETLAL